MGMDIKKKDGFTLMELMVTVAIIGILAAVAIPGFSRWFPNYRLRVAASDLFSNLQLAKMEAIKRNADCSITYTASGYSLSWNGKTVNLADYKSNIHFKDPAGGTAYPSTAITFNSRGTCNSGYAYFTHEKENVFYRVGPISSGVIYLKKWNDPNWE